MGDGLASATSFELSLLDVAQPLRDGSLNGGLQGIMARIHDITERELNDDLALLAAEYSPLTDLT